MGLHRAGFDVIGVDIDPQPRYPFVFRQGDALDIYQEYFSASADRIPSFVWASPPCQGRTAYKRRPDHVKPIDTDGMIERTRGHLETLRARHGVHYVIENVPGAPLRNTTLLCGSMFPETLGVRRHRIFEASYAMAQPACHHERQNGSYPPATNRTNRRKTAEIGVWRIPLAEQRKAMGIDWMELHELSEAIPPAYSAWLGFHALTAIRGDAARSAS